MTAVEYSDAKAMAGYSSNQTSGVAARDHSWHGASSKQHGYGASAGSAGQWSGHGTAASAAVSARSDWSGRGGPSAAAGGGSSFVSSAKNVMGMSEPSRSGGTSASSRATHDVRYDAYKAMANSATRRY